MRERASVDFSLDRLALLDRQIDALVHRALPVLHALIPS
jgi:hypothetical protein